ATASRCTAATTPRPRRPAPPAPATAAGSTARTSATKAPPPSPSVTSRRPPPSVTSGARKGATIMRVHRIGFAALAGGLGALGAAPGASAKVICVTPPSVNSCQDHKIGVAQLSAAPGDTILLAPGTYYDDDIEIHVDGLTISGANKTATILDLGNNTAL